MLISALHPSRREQAGFSLIELVVVLGLITLIGAVVFPGLVRFYESIQREAEQQAIVADINGLGRQAWEGHTTLVLKDALKLPAGWAVETPTPVTYRSNGVCLGGSVRLLKDGVQRNRFNLAAPFCQVGAEGKG